MDYRINNEAVIGCVVMQVAKRGPYEVPFVISMVNLLMQKKLRKKVLTMSIDNVKGQTAAFGQLNGDLLGVIVNSMTMLIEGGCLRRNSNQLEVTVNGLQLCGEIEKGDGEMLKEVLSDINEIIFKYECIDRRSLYCQMWIDV